MHYITSKLFQYLLHEYQIQIEHSHPITFVHNYKYHLQIKTIQRCHNEG